MRLSDKKKTRQRARRWLKWAVTLSPNRCRLSLSAAGKASAIVNVLIGEINDGVVHPVGNKEYGIQNSNFTKVLRPRLFLCFGWFDNTVWSTVFIAAIVRWQEISWCRLDEGAIWTTLRR